MELTQEIPVLGGKIILERYESGLTAGIYFQYANEDEVVCWVDDEWEEDRSAVDATANALFLGLTVGMDAVRDLLYTEEEWQDRIADLHEEG
jgi:hypothetical protein